MPCGSWSPPPSPTPDPATPRRPRLLASARRDRRCGDEPPRASPARGQAHALPHPRLRSGLRHSRHRPSAGTTRTLTFAAALMRVTAYLVRRRRARRTCPVPFTPKRSLVRSQYRPPLLKAPDLQVQGPSAFPGLGCDASWDVACKPICKHRAVMAAQRGWVACGLAREQSGDLFDRRVVRGRGRRRCRRRG